MNKISKKGELVRQYIERFPTKTDKQLADALCADNPNTWSSSKACARLVCHHRNQLPQAGAGDAVQPKVCKAIIYADRHTGIEDVSCDRIFKQYIRDNQHCITHVVDLGDSIDNPFMSLYPVDPETVITAQQEIDLYVSHLKEIHTLVPQAQKVLIAGNHDIARLSNSARLNRGLASLRVLHYKSVIAEAASRISLPLDRVTFVDQSITIKYTKSYSDTYTHGDPKLDPHIKGGVTGVRRTAEMYPVAGNVYMGHGHWYQSSPRKFAGMHCVMLGGLFNVEKMSKMYINYHPYENGFGVATYSPSEDSYVFNYYPIINGRSYIDGRLYLSDDK